MCLIFRQNYHKMRLFVTDFECNYDIVVSYVVKSIASDIHLTLILKMVNDKGENLIVECGDNLAAKSEIGRKVIPVMLAHDLDKVIKNFSDRKEHMLPPDRCEVTDWHSRFHYLTFHPDVKSLRIVDVGVSVAKEGRWEDDDHIKLGALQLQPYITDNRAYSVTVDNAAEIHSRDFVD